MAGDIGWIRPGTPRDALERARHRRFAQRLFVGTNVPGVVDRTKHKPVVDPRCGNPCPHVRDRGRGQESYPTLALLIGFAARN